jgi:hypothetical protein
MRNDAVKYALKLLYFQPALVFGISFQPVIWMKEQLLRTNYVYITAERPVKACFRFIAKQVNNFQLATKAVSG